MFCPRAAAPSLAARECGPGGSTRRSTMPSGSDTCVSSSIVCLITDRDDGTVEAEGAESKPTSALPPTVASFLVVGSVRSGSAFVSSANASPSTSVRESGELRSSTPTTSCCLKPWLASEGSLETYAPAPAPASSEGRDCCGGGGGWGRMKRDCSTSRLSVVECDSNLGRRGGGGGGGT
jgi:hypothetical protein